MDEAVPAVKWALMTRVCCVDFWGWTTLQVFNTYEEAARCQKRSTELVEFQSEKWERMKAFRDKASAPPPYPPQESFRFPREETIQETVSRIIPSRL